DIDELMVRRERVDVVFGDHLVPGGCVPGRYILLKAAGIHHRERGCFVQADDFSLQLGAVGEDGGMSAVDVVEITVDPGPAAHGQGCNRGTAAGTDDIAAVDLGAVADLD